MRLGILHLSLQRGHRHHDNNHHRHRHHNNIGNLKMRLLLLTQQYPTIFPSFWLWKLLYSGVRGRGLMVKVIVIIVLVIIIVIIIIIFTTTWRAAGHSAITSAACLRARLALCSPSAAITCQRIGNVIIILSSLLYQYHHVPHSSAFAFVEKKTFWQHVFVKCLLLVTFEVCWSSSWLWPSSSSATSSSCWPLRSTWWRLIAPARVWPCHQHHRLLHQHVDLSPGLPGRLGLRCHRSL